MYRTRKCCMQLRKKKKAVYRNRNRTQDDSDVLINRKVLLNSYHKYLKDLNTAMMTKQWKVSLPKENWKKKNQIEILELKNSVP